MLAKIVLALALLGKGAAHEPSALHYRLKPLPQRDRTDLEVSVRFKADGAGPVVVGLPVDCYGLPDASRFVTAFTGEAGTRVAPGADGLERVVQPGAHGQVSLRYVLSFDPGVMDGVAFAPNVGAGHFHVAGCQWLLRIGAADQPRRHVIELSGAPRGWKLYSTLGPDARRTVTTASHEGLSGSAMGGGAGGFHRFRVHSRPVSVFVDGDFDVPRRDIYAAVERIVRLQRAWFNDPGQLFFHVAVRPRSGIIAGAAVENAFIAFVKRDARPQELNLLFAHEMFHGWLPGKLRIATPPGETASRHEWFTEGFTEYFARRLLADAGLLSDKEFADLVNLDILNLADNPNRNATYEELVAAVNARAFSSAFKNLAYYRGALMALDWDFRLQARGQGLSRMVRDLVALAEEQDGVISEEAFFNFVAARGLDARADFERHILRGESLVVSPEALGPGFVARAVDVPSFEPGFSLEATFQTRVVTGVVRTGPAYAVGLRDGMELVSVRNSGRGIEGWSKERLLEVMVRVDGQERRISLLPWGPARSLSLFAPR